MASLVEDTNSQTGNDPRIDSSEVPISSASINGYPNGIYSQNINGIKHETPKDISEPVSQEPVAICGMSVRLPGGIHAPQQLWNFLISKGDARGPVPKSRYNASAYHSTTHKSGSIKTEYGYFLDESIDIASMDTSFFTMGKSEVERADPQQRQMLEVARECIEDAGEVRRKDRVIGCFMGSFGEDWVEMFAKENQHHGLHRAAGSGDFMLANRISYEMNLTGPRYVVQLPFLALNLADLRPKVWLSVRLVRLVWLHSTKHVWHCLEVIAKAPLSVVRT